MVRPLRGGRGGILQGKRYLLIISKNFDQSHEIEGIRVIKKHTYHFCVSYVHPYSTVFPFEITRNQIKE